jgi:anhydro-N-acetylmuramic acid kinase
MPPSLPLPMRVVGIMSGTSGDGVDVAVTLITPNAVAVDQVAGNSGGGGSEQRLQQEQKQQMLPPDVKLLGCVTVPFEPAVRSLIFQLFSQKVTLQEVCDANFILGRVFGEAVVAALEELHVPLDSVDLVASHGQTVYHNPPTSTLQIGDAAVIAERTRCTVAADFRTADVAYGGQGAPVTSVVDALFLARDQGWRAVQNIGGFANVTFVPPRGSGAAVLAFDTGPGNALLDGAVYALTGSAFDEDGKLAASSSRGADESLLTAMLQHPYFSRAPPKTTGREEFTAELGERWLAQGQAAGLDAPTIVATFTELTAVTIGERATSPRSTDKTKRSLYY